jgi:hypothetical protein
MKIKIMKSYQDHAQYKRDRTSSYEITLFADQSNKQNANRENDGQG